MRSVMLGLEYIAKCVVFSVIPAYGIMVYVPGILKVVSMCILGFLAGLSVMNIWWKK